MTLKNINRAAWKILDSLNIGLFIWSNHVNTSGKKYSVRWKIENITFRPVCKYSYRVGNGGSLYPRMTPEHKYYDEFINRNIDCYTIFNYIFSWMEEK